MAKYIQKLIGGGENQHLDFKFEVSDFHKIARTLSAFSNTEGGKLLVGVKDNGAIAGVRSEEEFYMVDGAARLYCKPEVEFLVKEWNVEGKKVLEVIIEPGKHKPYFAQDTDGNWHAYIRQADQTFKASRVILKVWEKQQKGQAVTIRFRKPEKELLEYLEAHSGITVSKFRRISGLSIWQAEGILVDFVLIGILKVAFTPASSIYSLVTDYQSIVKEFRS
jgi:hypothetical protein